MSMPPAVGKDGTRCSSGGQCIQSRFKCCSAEVTLMPFQSTYIVEIAYIIYYCAALRSNVCQHCWIKEVQARGCGGCPMGLLPAFYTARYVEIHSPTLSLLWLFGPQFLQNLGAVSTISLSLRLIGGAVVLWTLLVSLLGQHAYVERHVPNVDVAFWQACIFGSIKGAVDTRDCFDCREKIKGIKGKIVITQKPLRSNQENYCDIIGSHV